ncbi:hypothetical protein C0991_004918 [Blastosporella zonata]|nr:hypothetical protein C0991_004918 [Blastosporella zonata]
MDSGAVGVVDLTTKAAIRMKSKHDSVRTLISQETSDSASLMNYIRQVCGSVKFIPDRPRELVSGGYDTALLHFDYHEGKILSTRKIPPYEAVGGIGLSPPFVTSIAISLTGIIAAGTADGRLLIGCGGYKAPQGKSGKKKRSRKWEGLSEDKEVITKKAEGPFVALSFDGSGVLTASTLLGVMSRYQVFVDDDEGSVVITKLWQDETQSVKKVNTLVVDEKRVVVGGLTAGGKGVIEIWNKDVNYEIYGLPTAIPP